LGEGTTIRSAPRARIEELTMSGATEEDLLVSNKKSKNEVGKGENGSGASLTRWEKKKKKKKGQLHLPQRRGDMFQEKESPRERKLGLI